MHIHERYTWAWWKQHGVDLNPMHRLICNSQQENQRHETNANQQELDGCSRKVSIVLWLTICHSSYTHTSFRSTYTNRIWKKISKYDSVKELGSDINRNWWPTERLPRVQSGKTMPTSFPLIICPRALRMSGKKSLTTDSPERPVETSSRGYTELFIMSRRGI